MVNLQFMLRAWHFRLGEGPHFEVVFGHLGAYYKYNIIIRYKADSYIMAAPTKRIDDLQKHIPSYDFIIVTESDWLMPSQFQ